MIANGLLPSPAISGEPWRPWLERNFPDYMTAPFAERQVRVWDWFAALRPGVRPPPRTEVWPRGGGKSTTIEGGCAYVGAQKNPPRKYALYVSETQEMANKHVQAAGTMLDRAGIRRAVNRYGSSKGWSRTQLRTDTGFNISAFGLDAGMRGIKLDQYRPDLIIFDDIDGRHDSPLTIEKKIATITETILPAGSADAAVIIVQNLVHRDSIVARLANGTADFLHDRAPVVVEPAVHGLKYELVHNEDGTHRYVVTDGTATWAGQDIETCERQLNEWGLRAFRREAQHEVDTGDELIFPRHWWNYWQPVRAGLPPVRVTLPNGHTIERFAAEKPDFHERGAMSWDMNVKETEAGSYTVGLAAVKIGANGYLLPHRYRDRPDFPDAIRALRALTQHYPEIDAKLIEDKANGPAAVSSLRHEIGGLIAVPVKPGDTKESRAHATTPRVEAGNWYLPHPLLAPWVDEFIDELASFPTGTNDDQVDAFGQLDRYLFGNASPSITAPRGILADWLAQQ